MAVRIKGVDISAWQEGIPFDEIKKAGVRFAIIRAGRGKNKDSQLDKFVAECKKHGIIWFDKVFPLRAQIKGSCHGKLLKTRLP